MNLIKQKGTGLSVNIYLGKDRRRPECLDMGKTLVHLSERKLPQNKIFDNRFVVESCEAIHVHYRNIRIFLDVDNWKLLAEGFKDSLARFFKMGNPEGGHTELCRKNVTVPSEETVKVNLNENVYLKYQNKVWSKGSELEDPKYIHFKYRNIRIEMSLEEFEVVSDAVLEAKEALCRKLAS